MNRSTFIPKRSLELLRAGWEQGWLKGWLLVVAVVCAYQPVWHAGFIWDDDVYVTQNPLLTAPDGLKRIWFSLDSPSQYFPLTYTTFWLERLLWGLDPAGYHGVNLLLHTLNGLLVWRLLKRLSVPGAWLAAAIFALHPVQVESVAWITERKNVLSLFFCLLAVRSWVEFVADRPSPRRVFYFYWLSLTFYGLGLCSKTTACTLPAALLLILWLQGKPVSRIRLIQLIPFLVLGVGMGWVTMWWERYHQGTQGALFACGPVERVLLASRAVWFYLGKLVWPVNLTFSYPRWRVSAGDPLAYGWVAAGTGLGALIYIGRRYAGRGVEVAALFYVATLSPMLGFIMLYTFLFASVADHYQYVASIGPIALAAAGISEVFGRLGAKRPLIKPVFCGMLLAVLSVLTWRQCGMYANAETLWRTTLARNPNSYLAHNNLGNILFRNGRMDEAMEHYQKALAIHPQYDLAHNNLGLVLFRKGRVDEAVEHYQKAVEIQPQYVEAHDNLGNAFVQQGRVDEAILQFQKAVEIQPQYAKAHNNLGIAFLKKNQADQAVVHFEAAVTLQPDNADFHNNLGTALLRNRQADEAIIHFQKAVKIQPDLAKAQEGLGLILLQQGRMDEAIIHYQNAVRIEPLNSEFQNNLGYALFQKGAVREATACYQKSLEIRPQNPMACKNLAWMLATCPEAAIRNGTQAVRLAEEAVRLCDRPDPIFIGTLAAAYAEVGRFPEAVAAARRAQQLAGSQSNTDLVDALQIQIGLYQAGVPYHDASSTSAPVRPK